MFNFSLVQPTLINYGAALRLTLKGKPDDVLTAVNLCYNFGIVSKIPGVMDENGVTTQYEDTKDYIQAVDEKGQLVGVDDCAYLQTTRKKLVKGLLLMADVNIRGSIGQRFSKKIGRKSRQSTYRLHVCYYAARLLKSFEKLDGFHKNSEGCADHEFRVGLKH